ncbi:MAG: hypothetical protein A3F87_01280 [Omnitrophica WOR_2 bacterium RIFCSPLOWO2_12_FULL_51_24]|nr:MAG: hypothetical protein A3I43_00335 [Omnitrophica WOR_2 bacterium RIFCSPLOWO2_02_FULL_50_19]OGX42407.1 MAG: hypothetical protein A3F87_01280 [Omnitrophica WOR_2 bacterium RIFCSPLOWO2_12_FULL_51_24]
MNRIEDYINLPYSIELVPDLTSDGLSCYMACHPELPGCMSHGQTPEEAIANLTDARRIYLEVLLKKSQQIPLPQASSIIWEITDEEERVEDYSVRQEVSPILSIELNQERI